jgi:hypothetical protein
MVKFRRHKNSLFLQESLLLESQAILSVGKTSHNSRMTSFKTDLVKNWKIRVSNTFEIAMFFISPESPCLLILKLNNYLFTAVSLTYTFLLSFLIFLQL